MNIEAELAIIKAVKKTDKYFKACAEFWSKGTDGFRKIEGHPVIAGERLDKLCNEAGEAVRIAMAYLDSSKNEWH